MYNSLQINALKIPMVKTPTKLNNIIINLRFTYLFHLKTKEFLHFIKEINVAENIGSTISTIFT